MADTAEALFGWPIEEIIGKHFALPDRPDSMALAAEKFAAVGATPGARRARAAHPRPPRRSTFAAEVTTTGVFEDGRWVGAQGTVRDVSERVRLERELRESEERYRYLVQNAPDLVWSIDADAKLTFLSDACERLTGFQPEELLGKHFGAIVHESSRDVAEIDWTLAMAAADPGAARPASACSIATARRSRPSSSRSPRSTPTASSSAPTARSATCASATAWSTSCGESEERYRFLVDNSPDIVFAIDAGRAVHVTSRSRSGARSAGPDRHARRSAYGSVIQLRPARGRGACCSTMMQADPDLELHDPDGARSTPTAELIPFEVSVVGVRVDGEFGGIHGAARDIGERERLERDLRDSEERYRFLVENSPGHRVRDRRRGPLHLPVGGDRDDDRLRPRRAHRPAVLGPARRVDAGRPRPSAGRPSSTDPDRPRRILILRGKDGRRTPVDIRAIGIVDDGTFSGHPGRDPRHQRPGPPRDASCAARPASWRPARSAPTSPASSTTRSPRRSSR